MAKTGAKKGGAGIVEALWAGTAVFAATKAKSYSGFVTSLVVYSIVLIIVLAAATWVMKALGIQMKEGFAGKAAFGQCPNGGSPTTQSDGTTKCVTAAGNVDITTTPDGPTA
jgi:hypothetical protein